MPFQSVNNTAKFDCLFAINHVKRAQFSVYVNNDAASWVEATLATKAGEISDAIIASYVPALSSDHDFLGVIATDLELQFGLVVEDMEAAAVPGTLVSPSLPANVAVCATLKSAVGAPRRGRWFFMPPAEGQVVNDLLSLAAQSDLQDAADAIGAAATAGAGNSHVIVSRYSGKELAPATPEGEIVFRPTQRPNGVVANVASIQVRRRTDSQRNRLSAEPA